MKINPPHNNPRSIQARNLLFHQALEQEKLGQYKKALEFYQMSLKIDGKFFDSWLNAGALYSRLGKRKKAIICYQRALIQQPDKRAFYNLASEYFRDGKYTEARKLLTQAVKLDRNFLQAHLLLGYCYGRLDENEKAEISILNVLKIDQANRPAQTALALLYFHTGKTQKCAVYVNKLLRANPADIIALRLKANLELAGDNLRAAILSFRDFAEKDPKIAEFQEALTLWAPGLKKDIPSRKAEIAARKDKSARDWLDLSLLTLFEGNTAGAMDFLLEAENRLQS